MGVTRGWTDDIRPVVVLAMILAAGVSPAAGQGASGQSNGLEHRVSALEAQALDLQQQVTALQQQVIALESASQNTSVSVNCSAGQSVAAALSQLARRTGHVTVTIIGTCTEAVVISRGNTTLRGAAPGHGLIGPSSSSTVVTVVGGAVNVTLSQLTINGGAVGVRVNHGADVVVSSSQVHTAGFHGIFVDGNVDLRQSTVDGAGGAGVFAWVGSTVRMTGSVISNSAERGLELQINATAQVSAGSRIVDNQRNGVGLWHGSVLNLRDATVENNKGNGIVASGGSSVLLGTGTVVRGNEFHGLSLGDTSVAGSFGSAQITGNGGWGVFCGGPPAVAQLSGSLGSVSGNAVGQSNCPQP